MFNFFGTVTVIVPEGITATVEGGGMFASQVIEPPGAPPVPGSRAAADSRLGTGRDAVRSQSQLVAPLETFRPSTKCFVSSFG